MSRFLLSLLLCALLWASGAPGVDAARAQEAGGEAGRALVDTDFGRAGLPREAQRSERVSGSLPAPWRDTSSWAHLWVSHQRMEEGGRAFQRMAVSRLQDGRAQIVHLLPDLSGQALLSLRLALRASHELPLTLGIRQQGEPYKYLWSRSVVLDEAWQELSWTFAEPRSTQPVMLILEVPAAGQLDLARVQLSEISPAQAAQNWKRERPASAGPNLLRTSRLPLGMQSGWWFHQALWNWSIDYGTPPLPAGVDSQAQIEVDEGTVGPSGAPAARITAPRGFGLYSAPFAVPLPFGPHTASVHLRGAGRGSWIVWGDGKELARRDFDLKEGDGWQRQQATFAPDINIQVYALRWEGSGTFWVDGLQVEAGDSATPFAPGMPAEVALASASAGGAPLNVQWLEDDPTVQFAVLGASPEKPGLEGARLKARVVSIYGESKALPDVRLVDKYLQRGQLSFGAFARRPLGVFRVEAWVEGTGGARLSETFEIVVNRLRKPRYWGRDAPGSPFGTHVVATGRSIAMAKAIGVNWVRGHDIGMDYLGWFYLEPRPGEWKFRDAELMRYRAGGLKILGMLQTAPHWASVLQTPHDVYFDMFYQPKSPEAFGNYVRTVAARYKGVIDAYEVWSEPWNYPWFAASYDESLAGRFNEGTPTAPAGYRPSASPQADYARLMQQAYRNAKAVDPNITILGFNTTTAQKIEGSRLGGEEWTRGVLENGGLESCDVVSYHHYMSEAAGGAQGGATSDEVERGFRFATGPIAAKDKDGAMPRPIWLSEGSPITELSREAGFYRHTLPYASGEAVTESSDRLCRFVVSLLGQNARKVFLYSMHGGGFFGQPNEFGLLMHRDGSLHPTGVAYSQMAWQLEDTRFARRVALGPKVWAYLFEGRARSVAVLMSRVPQSESGHALPDAEARRALVEMTDLWGNDVAPGSALGATVVYASSQGPLASLERALKAAPW